VNQACVESGLGAEGKAMLADADVADVVMAPAADMFEMGVDVQVLKRGTMFGVRAKKLYELYRSHGSLSEIPEVERQRLERDYFRVPLEQEWSDTRAYWMDRDASEVERADRDPKHQMALVFRAYLGQASRWAINEVSDRRVDYQIWCGPAMGAFNAWVKGSFLEKPANRTVTQVARNLMEGAAVVTRAQQLRTFGVPIPAAAFDFRPRPLA
jgi:PfaD family protein